MKKNARTIALAIAGGLFLCCAGGTTLGLLLPDTGKAPAPASSPDTRGIIGTPLPTATRDVVAEEAAQEAEQRANEAAKKAEEDAAKKAAATKEAAAKKAAARKAAAEKKRKADEARERREQAAREREQAEQQEDEDTGGGSAYYANCSAARAAGAAPLSRGEPGYRSALDRDNDGVACE